MPSPSEIQQQDRVKFLNSMKEKYERLFATPDGVDVLSDICRSGLLDRSAFSSDALEMSYNIGKQDFAKHIKDMALKVDRKEIAPTEAIR